MNLTLHCKHFFAMMTIVLVHAHGETSNRTTLHAHSLFIIFLADK